MKMFGLADCNNFYVSCERIFNLSLRGVPVVVLSNNDGCVISRSQEAKEVGVKMGVPIFEIKHLVKAHNIQVFSSNYALYGDISSRVMNCLLDLCPDVEVYSIDESFLDLTILPKNELYSFGLEVKRKILKWTKIPICIGIAPTKALAKIANKVAKKDRDGSGIYVIDSEEKRIELLRNFDLEDVWGVGRQHAKFLKAHGVKSAYDLSNLDDRFVQKNMSITGLRLVKELRGESCIPMLQPRVSQQGICCSRSFGETATTFEGLSEAVTNFAFRCGEKLRRQNTCANVITVFIYTNRFNKSKPQYSKSITMNFEVPVNNSHEILKYAVRALRLIYKDGYEYKKAGVILTGIIPETQQQIGIFDTEDREKLEKLSKLMDKVNSKFGRNTLNLAIQSTPNNWHPNAKNLSPRYTTSWDDIPKIET